MGPRHGRRDEPARGLARLVTGVGRLVAFVLLAGSAMAIFAGVVLLPDYVRLLRAERILARQEAIAADTEARIRANGRLIEALPDHPVLTKRLAMHQLGLRPADEVVVPYPGVPVAQAPGTVAPPPHPRPAPPDAWVLRIAARVSNPPTRRGLLLLAAVALVGAVLLFPGRDRSSAAEE